MESALRELDGVTKVEADLSTSKVEVEGEGLNDILIKGAVEDAGYDLKEIR